MTAIPIWLTGPGGGYVVSLTPQTVGVDGTLTAGSVSTLTTVVDKVSVNYKAETEEINGMTATRLNTVKTRAGTTVSITEILQTNAASKIAGLVAAGDYYKAIITRGGNTWTFYGLATGYDEDLVRGKSTGTLTLEMVDPNTANPAYV